jgi:hypothetical protein
MTRDMTVFIKLSMRPPPSHQHVVLNRPCHARRPSFSARCKIYGKKATPSTIGRRGQTAAGKGAQVVAGQALKKNSRSSASFRRVFPRRPHKAKA